MFERLAAVVATSLAVITAAPATPPTAAEPGTTTHVIAHRGASAYAPENTIAAFELAGEQGADMFELDVQETEDHQLVLMHDTTLTRTTDVEQVHPGRSPWNVRDFTLSQIRKLDAGSWKSRAYAHESVPTLGEALHAMQDSGMGLLLEVKSPELYPGIEARIAAELRRHPSWSAPGRVIVQSFDWESMRRFHELMPEVAVGLLGTPPTGRLRELAAFASQIHPQYGTLSASYVRRVHGFDMEVFTWTVDDVDAMRRMIGHGVDGVITNRPDALRDLVDS
ncbi:glycerophosphoryl diester phosphodiesterase [Nonomuraea maritima]|uniref:Glycerophosphoryl diester phosphodiesterase n=1 Tax=Nonomuraea maritima TaxID=683260 RepID=A0A1G9NNE6_9ACTN|nr:glycerophosphodiester phosphodiesterase family protein [Nonomuraea maritima]SDL87861.1 glycerophosphoryl diester phosphodiesterase [Nonomuraea maritima]